MRRGAGKPAERKAKPSTRKLDLGNTSDKDLYVRRERNSRQ